MITERAPGAKPYAEESRERLADGDVASTATPRRGVLCRKGLLTLVLSMGCLSAGFAWGRQISVDLRAPQPVTRVQTAAKLAASSSVKTDGFLRKVNLDAGAADVGEVAVGDELTFTLFDDVTIALTLKEKMSAPLGGDVFLAEASGYEGVKNAVVLRTIDGLTVDIQDYQSGLVYKVISTRKGVAVQEIKPAEGRKCGCDVLKAPSMPSSTIEEGMRSSSIPRKAKSISGETQPVTVDILVAYDTTAAEWARENGGGLQTFAEAAVQKMNTAIANSFGLGQSDLSMYDFTFRLVGIYEIGGPGFVRGDDPNSACEDALDAAKDGATFKGVSWAGVADMRDEVGADIVVTLIDTGTASGTVGIGYAFEATSSGFSGSAYNCCAIRSVAESHTMTHEVGHNMGAGHATEVNPAKIDPGPQYYPYSAGYYFRASDTYYHTIMAYDDDGFGNSYREVPYFSTPDETYLGVKVGDSSHNNALTIQNNYAVVAAFRKSKEEMEEEPLEEEGPVQMGEFNGFTWRTSECFPWRVCTNYTWVSGVGYQPSSFYMYSGDFRNGGAAPFTGESWVEAKVAGPARLGFKYRTYMAQGPFKVTVDGVTQFSTQNISGWADVDLLVGEHTVRFTFVCNDWYCGNDTYNGVNVYDIRLDTLDARPVIVPESTDDEYTATQFTASLDVVITNNVPGSVIYYTLDDSEPTTSSQIYVGPFTITNSTVVKAVALQDDGSLTMPVTSLLLERHPVLPGEWTADAEGAISAAAKNGNLIIVQYTESEDGECTRSCKMYADITESAEFTDWAKQHGVYLVAYDEGWPSATLVFSMNYIRTYPGRSRYLENESAYNYYVKTKGDSWPAICIARAWLPYVAVGMSSLENGSYVGGVQYDGTAAKLIEGLETYLQSEQRPPADIEVAVSFDVQGGTMEQTNRLYRSGQPFGELPPDPSRYGYTFTGWYDAATGGTQVTSDSVIPEDETSYSLTIYAHWAANAYKARFHPNASEEYPATGTMADQDFVYDSAQSLLPNQFSRPGYEFQGWSTYSNDNYVSYMDGALISNLTAVAGDVIDLYAVWNAEPVPGESLVTSDANDGLIGGNGGDDSGTGGGATGGGDVVGDWNAGRLNVGFAKAQTVLGALYGRDGVPVGTVQVKAGKINKKKGTVKISATTTLLVNGKAKKVTAKAVDVAATSAAAPVKIAFKAPIGEMTFEMAADGTFTLKNASYVMAEKKVGGNWTRAGARVYVAATSAAAPAAAGTAAPHTALPAGTIEELLPDGEPVIPKAGKWSFAKAAGVKWAKPKKGAGRPEIFDEASGKGLIVDDAKGKTNLSGLKLTYTPKTGIFTGSFKIYAIQGGKLKKITVKVAGVVVDGKGWGSATGPGGVSFAVTVE